ncbi:MAG: 16S rRNA (cytosine(967)-C(5))-methyltransferase RsmB [Deltaproteobacteria bacterium]|nr:16S rRNA (cytosine(967)-C(5))-methyltransferase RsmB [Deltaproteobacteria bacterium]
MSKQSPRAEGKQSPRAGGKQSPRAEGKQSPRAGARQVALMVLARVRRDAAYSNLALSGELSRQRHLSSADRGLATELVYGTLRHQRFLDHAIDGLLKSKKALDPEVRDILRVATYQLLMLDRVPRYAVVNEAVDAARRLRGAHVGGFVNAILRRMGDNPPSRSACDDLALRCSLPDALAREFVAQCGAEEGEKLAEALLLPASLIGRVNTTRGSREEAATTLQGEGAKVEPVDYAPAGLRISGFGGAFESDSYLHGLWTAQDEAAQLVTLLLEAKRGERVLDACAGVGGKATHLAELCDEPVVCWDVNARKLQLLEEHALRLGVRCETRVGDFTTSGDDVKGDFDCVLVDAPCSGIGVLRRHPELKWREASNRAELVALQRRLLTRAIAALKPGGRLVYSVCTITEEEGPQQLAWALERFGEVSLEAPTDDARLLGLAPTGELRLWPHRHGMDGFYAMRLKKKE